MCRRIGDECDVTSMTGEEVMCTKMITLCTDEELKAELMKPELPTIPGLMQIVHQYERSQAGKLALQQAQQANTVGSRGNFKNGKRTQGQLANSSTGKCKGCGGAHQRDKCPHKDSTCHACGIKAHIKAVCRASEEKRKAYAANKGKKPQQANTSTQPASEGEEEDSAQALCTTPPMDTVAAVSPYLSYVHIIFDANQPGSRPMHHLFSTRHWRICHYHTRPLCVNAQCASQQQGKRLQGSGKSGATMQRVNKRHLDMS